MKITTKDVIYNMTFRTNLETLLTYLTDELDDDRWEVQKVIAPEVEILYDDIIIKKFIRGTTDLMTFMIDETKYILSKRKNEEFVDMNEIPSRDYITDLVFKHFPHLKPDTILFEN
jgi:hypothetical protein